MKGIADIRRARRSYADGPMGQVHFHDLGSGRPLVLLHQAPMCAQQFDKVRPLLSAAGIRTIAIDLPGFGGSAFVAGTVPLERVHQYVLWMVSGSAPLWYGHDAAFSYDHAARMMGIAHSSLVLTNTGDVIYQQALRAMALRPDFAFVALEGGGVDVVDQLPEAWTAAVVDFLKRPDKPFGVTTPTAQLASISF